MTTAKQSDQTPTQETEKASRPNTNGQGEGKHTPGEWTVNLEAGPTREVFAGDVLICDTGVGGVPDAERIANTHLIASAKVMLDAIKAIDDLRDLAVSGSIDPKRLIQAMDYCRHARRMAEPEYTNGSERGASRRGVMPAPDSASRKTGASECGTDSPASTTARAGHGANTPRDDGAADRRNAPPSLPGVWHGRNAGHPIVSMHAADWWKWIEEVESLRAAAPVMLLALQKIAALKHADRTCSLEAQGFSEIGIAEIVQRDRCADVARAALSKASPTT
jgi:hypothetical protein